MRNLKRALSLALASVMVMGLMVVGTGASYADVSSEQNQEAIEVLQAVGVMTGDENGNFNPDANVTRNEMAVVMSNGAAFHHEKLNGKGYPFGKTAAELNEPERIMACIDIYQALTEDRPYKKGLSHEKTCEMLDDMAQKGFVDSDIPKKIRKCFGGI